MGKREDKITRAAHIKRHTRGTSNEISFSVLDAAKNALEGDDDGLKHRPGRISLFTLPTQAEKACSHADQGTWITAFNWRFRVG